MYELLRFLSSLINPHEPQNTETQVGIGLALVSTALEVGVGSLASFPSLLALAQDRPGSAATSPVCCSEPWLGPRRGRSLLHI